MENMIRYLTNFYVWLPIKEWIFLSVLVSISIAMFTIKGGLTTCVTLDLGECYIVDQSIHIAVS